MKRKDDNLTNFFSEYLKCLVGNKDCFNENDIKMAFWGALNDIDMVHCFDTAEVTFNARSGIENILNVIDGIARDVAKQQKKDYNSRSSYQQDDYLSIPEIAKEYCISQQAIRKACKEERLLYKRGIGKNKYLISRADIDIYMLHAKGKNFKLAS